MSGILPEHLKSKDALTLEEAQEKVRVTEHVLTAGSVAVSCPSGQRDAAGCSDAWRGGRERRGEEGGSWRDS